MPIKSGRYIITNSQHWNLAFLSDNNDGTSLLGCLEQDVPGQEWNVKELRNGRYSLVNFGHKMSASVEFHSKRGDHVVGRENDWLWLITEHDSGKYTIATANGKLRWFLEDAWPQTPALSALGKIILHDAPPSNPRCQWTFQEIGRVDTVAYQEAKEEAAMAKAELEQAKAEVARMEREVEHAKREMAQAKAEAVKWEEAEVEDKATEGFYYDNGDNDESMDISSLLKPIISFEDSVTTLLRPRGYKNVVRSPSGQELWEIQLVVQPDVDDVPVFSRAIALSKQGSWQEVVKQGLKAIQIHSDLRYENQDGLPETELLQICTFAMYAHNELEGQGKCQKWCRDIFPLLQTLYDLKPEDFRDTLAVHLSDLCFSLGKKSQYKEAARRGSQAISLLEGCYESNPSKYLPLYTEALTRLASAYQSFDTKLCLGCLTPALPLLEELCEARPEEYLLQLAECLVSIMHKFSSKEEEGVIYANKAIEVYERMSKESDNWMYREDLGCVAGWAANAYARLLNFKMAVKLGEKAIDSFGHSGSGDDDDGTITFWRKKVAAWKSDIRPKEEKIWKEQAKKLKSSYQSIASQL